MEWRNLSFRKVVQKEIQIMSECGLIPYFDCTTGQVDQQVFDKFFGSPEEDQAWEKYLANHVPLNTGSYGLLTRGMYALQLRPWLRAFPKEQFLVLKLESLKTKGVQEFMRPVWEHLDLPPHAVEDEEAKNTRGYQPMGEDIKAYLERFYEPHNRRLAEMLDDDNEWKNPWPYKI
jgi:hypothetical protein